MHHEYFVVIESWKTAGKVKKKKIPNKIYTPKKKLLPIISIWNYTNEIN